jgi:hypothetical protein
MIKFSDLPNDINVLIKKHYYISKIQKKVRNYFFRFTENRSWKHLRKILKEKVSMNDLKILWGNALVRKEWKQEPESWIHMLLHTSHVTTIIEEIRCNVWIIN